jgi:DNA uptake protein ComE-like DNA-binding protein
MPNPNRDGSIEDEPTQPQELVSPASPHEVVGNSSTIDLNRATESEIAEIDMIGKKLARSIVEHRTGTHGFKSWDDLKQVPGLDAMKIAELQRAARLGQLRS